MRKYLLQNQDYATIVIMIMCGINLDSTYDNLSYLSIVRYLNMIMWIDLL